MAAASLLALLCVSAAVGWANGASMSEAVAAASPNLPSCSEPGCNAVHSEARSLGLLQLRSSKDSKPGQEDIALLQVAARSNMTAKYPPAREDSEDDNTHRSEPPSRHRITRGASEASAGFPPSRSLSETSRDTDEVARADQRKAKKSEHKASEEKGNDDNNNGPDEKLKDLEGARIAPFGKEDTARELQHHAARTQDTLVDAIENAEVAEIKRSIFRSLTRLRAAEIKEFDTIARLETQAIDEYNDNHHYRAENPLDYIHAAEGTVKEDKYTSFHD